MRNYRTCIILVNYNSYGDTVECVKSIKEYSLSTPFIVVVDNASTEFFDTQTLSELYADSFYYKLDKNIGFGRANNFGIQWVKNNIKCDYIFLLNNDTIITNDLIQQLEGCLMNASDNVVMVTPKIFVYSNPNEIWYQKATIDFKKVTPTILPNSISGYTEFASGCAMFFRSHALFDLGGFDPFFFMYDEDVELCLRINNSGSKIFFCEESILYHKCQGSQVKDVEVPSNQLDPHHPSLLFYLRNTISNRKYIIRKHLSGWERIKSYCTHGIYWSLKAGQYFVHGKFEAVKIVLYNLLTKK